MLQHLSLIHIYNRSYGMNITTTGYNVGRYEKTSTDYEVQQMTDFKNYLDSKGIRLLYVNEPAKYIDDAYYTEQFGGESYLNRNADLFLQRISEAGIESLDLRDCIAEEGLDPMSLFYRTDHHWTVPALSLIHIFFCRAAETSDCAAHGYPDCPVCKFSRPDRRSRDAEILQAGV